MSLDQPQENKMMAAAPAKKEFHFPASALHLAHTILAFSLEEAEKIYHSVKVPIGGAPAGSTAVVVDGAVHGTVEPVKPIEAVEPVKPAEPAAPSTDTAVQAKTEGVE